jgi:hypothetical protein
MTFPLLVLALAAAGPVYSGTERNVRVEVPRIDATVEVDGHLSEPPWQEAARLTSFSQYAPDDGRAASDETEILVWYSPTAIYFGIRAAAPPGSIRATLAARDRIDNDDWIQILLSTFNDGRQATMFGVNPLGVQMDGAVVEGTGQGDHFGGITGGRPLADLSPDFVFDSKGHLTGTGYEVEVRIPFKSLRYQSVAQQDWGIHVIRKIQSSGHEDSWVPARRSAASFLGQAGTLAGLHDLRRGLVMDVSPVLTARADGTPSADGWSYDGQRPELGGNLRWGVTPNLTLNATVNPDFSQVEADATQFQIDPRQALFFPEKRPFFLDGIEFFATPNSLIYSRRIVAPVVATKLTGKIAGTTIAAISAVDDQAQSVDGQSHPLFTIARVQRDIGGASSAAVVYTNRVDGASDNHVAGADAHLVWRKIYSADLQAAVSRTTVGSAADVGSLWQAGLNRTGRRFVFRYLLGGNAPDFHAAAGFVPRSGVVNGSITHQVNLYGSPGALVEKWTGDVQVLGTWQYSDFTGGRSALEQKVHTNANFFLRGGWHTGFSVLVERYGYDGSIYDTYGVLNGETVQPFVGTPHLPNLDYVYTLDTPRLHGLSANVFLIWGRDENFFEWSSANIVYSFLTLEWRPTERLRVDFDHNLQSFARRTDGSYVGIRRVPRLKLEYQATRSMFFRYVGEYATNYQDDLRDDSRTNLPIVIVAPDGTFAPAVGVRQRSFRNDWLFSYQPTPGTVLFAGYGNTLANIDETRPALRRTTDGFFLKVSYLFRL